MKIQIRHLSKTYTLSRCDFQTVLEDINFTVAQDDFIVILGESGSGKSTFMNIVAGLTPASSGAIWIEREGHEPELITGPHPSRSMLFQQPSLLPWLTVEQNIAFGCNLRNEKENLAYRVNKFIEMMGLFGHRKAFPHDLSAGQAQRVCLARALIGRPELLLLDEPFAALDTLNRARLQEELINIWQSEKFTAIFVTHDIEEAILLGNKVVLLGGQPASIMDIFDITLRYPRNITDEACFHTKTRIIKRLKEIAKEYTLLS